MPLAIILVGLYLLNLPIAVFYGESLHMTGPLFYLGTGTLIVSYIGYELTIRSASNLWENVIGAIIGLSVLLVAFGIAGAVWYSLAPTRSGVVYVLLHGAPLAVYLCHTYVWRPYRREKRRRSVRY